METPEKKDSCLYTDTIGLNKTDNFTVYVYAAGDKHKVIYTLLRLDNDTSKDIIFERYILIEPCASYKPIKQDPKLQIGTKIVVLECLDTNDKLIRRIVFGILPTEVTVTNIDIDIPNDPQQPPMQEENTNDFTQTIIEKDINDINYRLVVSSMNNGNVSMSMSKNKRIPMMPLTNLWTSTFHTLESDGYVMDISNEGVITVHGVCPGIDRTNRFVWSINGLLLSVSLLSVTT